MGEHAVQDLSPSWYQNSNNANREYPPFPFNSGAEAYERFIGERIPPDSEVASRHRFCQSVDGNRGPLNFVREQNEKSDIQSLIEAMHAMTSQINRRNALPLSKEDLFSGNPLTYRRFNKHFDAYTAKGVADMTYLYFRVRERLVQIFLIALWPAVQN